MLGWESSEDAGEAFLALEGTLDGCDGDCYSVERGEGNGASSKGGKHDATPPAKPNAKKGAVKPKKGSGNTGLRETSPAHARPKILRGEEVLRPGGADGEVGEGHHED